MKKQELKPKALETGRAGAPSLSDLRALRKAQKETNQRVEELKLRLFRVTEKHMDQAVSLLRRWLNSDKK